jgi:hypothetical protein
MLKQAGHASDAERHQRQQDRIRAGGNTKRVLRAGERADLLLERLDLRSHDELAALKHTLKRGGEFGF